MYFKVAVRFFFLSFLLFFLGGGTSLLPSLLHHSIKEVVAEDGEIDFRMRNIAFSTTLSACDGWTGGGQGRGQQVQPLYSPAVPESS